MTDDVASFIGSIPGHYDQSLGPLIFADYASDIAQRVAACRPARVLEIAAGTGILTRHLRDVLPSHVRLTATDLNLPMLEVARTKFRPAEQVEFQPADAMALPFADASFDAVVCQFGVMFFPDKDRAYREVYRVLVPGGRYVFNLWDSHRHNAFGRIAHEVIGRLFPDDPPPFQSVPFSYRFEEAKDSLIDAAFTDINAVVLRLEKDVPDLTVLARGLVYGSPIIDQVRTRGGVEPGEIVAAMVQEYRGEYGMEPWRMPLQATVICATKPASPESKATCV